MANNPEAVVRELSAHSINTIGVIVNDGLARAEAPQAITAVTQGETCMVKTRAVSRPLPTHDRAYHAKRRRWSAMRPPNQPPRIAPLPAIDKGSAVAPADWEAPSPHQHR